MPPPEPNIRMATATIAATSEPIASRPGDRHSCPSLSNPYGRSSCSPMIPSRTPKGGPLQAAPQVRFLEPVYAYQRRVTPRATRRAVIVAGRRRVRRGDDGPIALPRRRRDGARRTGSTRRSWPHPQASSALLRCVNPRFGAGTDLRLHRARQSNVEAHDGGGGRPVKSGLSVSAGTARKRVAAAARADLTWNAGPGEPRLRRAPDAAPRNGFLRSSATRPPAAALDPPACCREDSRAPRADGALARVPVRGRRDP